MAETTEQRMDAEGIKNLIRNHAPEIRNQFKAEIIGIFGSYARGEQDSRSDVDVLVRFDKGTTLFNLVGLSDYLEKILGIPVDVVSEKSLHPLMRDGVLNDLVMV